MNLMSARGVLIPAALTFAGVLWWAGRGSHVAPEVLANIANSGAGPDATLESLESSRREQARGDTADLAEFAAEPDDMSEASFQDYVAGKYRFLFNESRLSPLESAALSKTLLERERIAVAINTSRQSSDAAAKEVIPRQQAELEALDRKAGTLLPPGDLAAFEVLKDSDIEQFQLDDFAGGASNVAPVSEADKKAILYTKLVYRQRFRQVLADSRFMRDDLDTAERKLAFADVRRALEASRDSYLQEARQYLYNDEQFALLRNYETTEFNDELEKLRRMAYGE
jgi:hypothetical protein